MHVKTRLLGVQMGSRLTMCSVEAERDKAALGSVQHTDTPAYESENWWLVSCLQAHSGLLNGMVYALPQTNRHMS